MKELIFAQTLKWEAEKGISDNPNDLGGATNDGITYKHYQAYCMEVLGIVPSFAHFKAMKPQEIMKFYDRIWRRLGLDGVENKVLAGNCFDFAFNSQYGKREIQFVLRDLGYTLIIVDNVFGPATVKALNDAFKQYGTDLIDMILMRRLNYLYNFIIRMPNQIEFVKGWMNRVTDWREFSKEHLDY